ncbi:asparaginase [Bacteriovorax stolpii]|uniref:Asparaginase n=1 Tax=Bacteriovorax stolpii TaxID=960 RepID=A0A2K9NTD5_BACTC|nr:asparaginase domain-containing protein [Bacteriovorax stolpii]AUN98747.1 asparaginase [Bacteriovorax stolpii]TDP55737.1 L-asparaginase [Bacteriovorax stolpii]
MPQKNNEKNAPKDVLLITTGGTIEKTYDEFDGSLENRGTSIKNRILSKLRLPYTNILVHPLLSKDSLYMDDADRKLICETISEDLKREAPIVVLHGTDTMALTAEYCFERIKNPAVPVVFTGAMIPMGFDDTDATQNVTEALLAARLLSPGFYISFHNQIFRVPHVQKNKEKRTFEEK